MLRILMIRHGESVNNVLSAISKEHFEAHRSVDPQLSDKGLAQAQCVGQFFKSPMASVVGPLAALYTSPVRRALQTTLPASQVLGLAPEVWPDIYETGGMWMKDQAQPGMPRSQMLDEFPTYQLPPEITEHGWYNVAQGKETVEMSARRAEKVAQRLWNMVRSQSDALRTVGLVAHHDLLDLLLQALLIGKASTCFPPKFSHFNCGMSCVEVTNDGSTCLKFLNSTEHMPIDLIKLPSNALVFAMRPPSPSKVSR